MDRKWKIVIVDYYYESIEIEQRECEKAGIELVSCHCKTEQEAIAAAWDADAIIAQECEITANVIEHLQHCKGIVRYGIGVDNIDLEAAEKKGIWVANIPDYGIDEVSNQAVALLMNCIKKLDVVSASVKAGMWNYRVAIPLWRMAGHTLGIVGLGRIGSMLAKKMSSFDLRILVYDPFISEEKAEQCGAQLVDFDTLVKESDYISLHCPLTSSTRGMFYREVFERMKRTAILVNTARGGVVNQKDLIWALQQGKIAQAGLDVVEHEPIEKDSPLLTMPQVTLTPHVAWYSEEAIETLQYKAICEAIRMAQGHAPLNQIDRKQLAK